MNESSERDSCYSEAGDQEGGDEARVSRAGSGRGESSFANGSPSSRALPPRAGWAVRQTASVSSSPLSPGPAVPGSFGEVRQGFTVDPSSAVEGRLGKWSPDDRDPATVRSASSSPVCPVDKRSASIDISRGVASASSPPAASGPSALTAGALMPPDRHQETRSPHQKSRHQTREPSASLVNRWPDRPELRGAVVPMSHNASPPSRPPSSASSASSSSVSNLPRVHGTTGHDHTRPLPPPRLPETVTPITTISSSSIQSLPAPLTAPLTPLSTSASFRSASRASPASTPGPQQSFPEGVVQGVPSASSVNTTTSSQARSPMAPTGVLDSSRGALAEVTLTVPRPDGERAVNEYVETPFRQSCPTAGSPNLVASQKCLKNERRHNVHHPQAHHRHRQHDGQSQQSAAQAKSNAAAAALVAAQARHQRHESGIAATRRHQTHLLQSSLSVTGQGTPVTKQPVSFTKEPSNALGSGSLGGVAARLNDPSLSIMCDFCGRCRCESCREPPPLPSRWLCDNSCFCSAETALDYASCLCCVKGLFYHCADSGSGTDSEAGGNCADEPCSCTGPRRTARWACLGALTLVLPCLLCYWPLKGCVAMCEACYARHAAQGCRCDPNAHGRHHNGAASVVSRDSRDPEKRLLDPVTPEL